MPATQSGGQFGRRLGCHRMATTPYCRDWFFFTKKKKKKKTQSYKMQKNFGVNSFIFRTARFCVFCKYLWTNRQWFELSLIGL
jgi:hypothetical protein